MNARICFPFLIIACLQARAIEVPRSAVIVQLGINGLHMKPVADTSINSFRMSYPGFYGKVTGESYADASNFVHFGLNLSLNRAAMENGYARISRLCMNYGIGKTYDHVKLTLSPGLCYSQVAYQNESLGTTVAETRFSGSLGLQGDLVLINDGFNYLGLFTEASFMIAKPSRWVHQLSFGISWKPVFRKKPTEPSMP